MRTSLLLKSRPLLSLSRGCVAAWHAGHLPYPSLSGAKLNDFIQNKHHAQLGSTSGADSNDPLKLDLYQGKPYLYCSGIAGNSAKVTDAAALRVTGNLDIRVRVNLPSYATGARQELLSKFNSGAGQRAYLLQIQETGSLALFLSPTGAGSSNGAVATSLTGGTPYWLRVAWRASDGRAQFFQADGTLTAPSGSDWTQISTDQTIAIGSIFAGTADLYVGEKGADGVEVSTGNYLRAQVYASIDGTSQVLDIDFTDPTLVNATRTSLTAVTGQTVTINRATSGRKAEYVDRPEYEHGTDDYDEVPDNADLNFGLASSFTVAVAMRQYATPVSNGRYLAKQNGSAATAAGYSLTSDGTNLAPRATAGDGTTGLTATGPTFTAGAVNVIGLRRRAGRDLVAFTNGALGTAVADTLTASLTTTNVLRFGSRSDSAATFQDFGWLAVAIFNRDLTDSEIRELNRVLLGVPV